MIDLTVVIPTFNGEQRLPQLLSRLRSQLNTSDFTWEIIVIDNNSSDRTAALVQTYQSNWPTAYPLNYYLETQQGTAWARRRGVTEAKGELVAFLDDDNLPALNWVKEAYEFGKLHPEAGAFASQVHGEYQTPPPPNFDKISGFLGITEKGDIPFIYEPKSKLLPPGLGLVVRRQAWQENVNESQRPFLTGPVGSARLASEDIEAILLIQQGGWEIWYNPKMETYHQIGSERLTKSYLMKVMENTGLVRYHIRRLRWKPYQELWGFPVGLVADLGRLIIHFFKYRNVLSEDIVAACQMEFLRCSLISPFYICRT